MSQKIHEYKFARGKVVERVTVTNQSDFRCVTIQFTDRSALDITIDSRIEMRVESVDFKTGNRKVRKKYAVIYERED